MPFLYTFNVHTTSTVIIVMTSCTTSLSCLYNITATPATIERVEVIQIRVSSEIVPPQYHELHFSESEAVKIFSREKTRSK